MKKFYFRYLLFIFSFFILATTPVFAQCTQYTDAQSCYSAGCAYNSGSCQPPAGSAGETAVSDFLPILISRTGGLSKLQSTTDILNALVPIIIVISGLILFFMLISGGFQILTSATNPDDAEKGKQKITNALIGFIIIFAAYWLTQIVETILGVRILNR